MKMTILIAGLVIAALNAMALVPALQLYAAYFAAGSLALALWLAVKIALFNEPAAPSMAPARTGPTPRVEAPPPPKPEVRNLSEAEAVALLGVFQAKGRLVDFLMDEISSYSDAQVGAAARVVHQGCKVALHEHFTVVPVSLEKEGSRITVPADAPVDEYSLVGKVAGEPPFSGVLAHKGWKATSVKLPRSLQADPASLPPIAPAQVALK